MKKFVLFLFALFLFLCVPSVYNAQRETAENIISDCDVTASDDGVSIVCDGKLDVIYETNRVDIAVPSGNAQGIYIKWDSAPSSCELLCYTDGGESVSCSLGGKGFLQEYCELPKGTVSFSVSSAEPMLMLELEVYSQGELPDSVHIWEETPSCAELMVISTHQDDELLFFGGTIPYYSGELKLDTVVVYAAYDNGLRLHEALEGLWQCGHYQHPIFFRYEDKLTYVLETALFRWGGEEPLTNDLTECIIKYKPQVIVSHDFNGEYGHGQHKAVAYCLSKALEIAAKGTEQGKWDTPKCYIHLYDKNSITVEWKDIKLEKLGGITALECARRGYAEHVSQHKFGYAVLEEGYGDCRKFGLFRSTVGNDSGTDFFENITPRIIFAPIPNGYISSDMKQVSSHNVYSRVVGENTEYLRYGIVNGAEGWFLCDSTGAVFSENKMIVPITDRKIPDGYGVSDSFYPFDCDFPVYVYVSDGKEVKVRYGTVQGKTAWYETDEKGELLIPVKTVKVEKQFGLFNLLGSLPEGNGSLIAILLPLSLFVAVVVYFGMKSNRRK